MNEEETGNGSDPGSGASIEEELRTLGRRFADVLHAAWTSEERRRIETELREGLRRFSEEIEGFYERTRESPAGERVRSKLEEARGRAAETEAAHRTRETVALGLRRLSEQLARLADRFKSPQTEPKTEDHPTPDDLSE